MMMMTTAGSWESRDCAICLNVLAPPIYQCSNGHLMCQSCENKLLTCPTCRTPLSKSQKIRNQVMESIVTSTTATEGCRNSSASSRGGLTGEPVIQNSPGCNESCILLCKYLGLECDVKSNAYNYLEHLNVHGITGTDLSTMSKPELQVIHRVRIRDIAPRQRLWDPTYVNINGELFFLKSALSSTGLLTWTVLAGSRHCAENHRVSIEVKAKELDETWFWSGKAVPLIEIAGRETSLFTHSHAGLLVSMEMITSRTPKTQRGINNVITWTTIVRFQRNPSANFQRFESADYQSRLFSLPKLVPVATMGLSLALLAATVYKNVAKPKPKSPSPSSVYAPSLVSTVSNTIRRFFYTSTGETVPTPPYNKFQIRFN